MCHETQFADTYLCAKIMFRGTYICARKLSFLAHDLCVSKLIPCTYIMYQKINFMCQEINFPDYKAATLEICEELNVRNCLLTFNTYFLTHNKCQERHFFFVVLLPVAIRGYLKPEIQTTLTELSTFFKQLCARTLKVDILKQMKEDIVIILSKLEQIFPPAYFDIMVHVAIHLLREAELAGPMQYHWMYPIERTLGKYKRYVRNRSQPEGSIVECYIADECLTFCSMYLRDIETRWNREKRSVDGCQEEEGKVLDVFS
jgi:hypothetical protein